MHTKIGSSTLGRTFAYVEIGSLILGQSFAHVENGRQSIGQTDAHTVIGRQRLGEELLGLVGISLLDREVATLTLISFVCIL